MNEVGRSHGRVWIRTHPWIRHALVLVVALGLVVVLVPSGVSQLGYWLVVADPLEPARAIVVLSGRVPFRAVEAASIYRQGGLARFGSRKKFARRRRRHSTDWV
jgi:hypothetical protein